jgi:hypothetical protein
MTDPGHRIIVARDRPEVLERARARFVDNPQIEVIVDRRVAERRRAAEGTHDLRLHPAIIVPCGDDVTASNGERPDSVRLEQWRRDTEWVLTVMLPRLQRERSADPPATVVPAELEELRRENERMRHERADMETQLAEALNRLATILRVLPSDRTPPS